jgi:hypothetical protein
VPQRIYRAVEKDCAELYQSVIVHDEEIDHFAVVISEVGSKEHTGSEIEGAPLSSLDEIPVPESFIAQDSSAESIQIEKEPQRPKRQRPRWSDQFRTDIGSALNQLEAWHLTEDVEMTARQVGRLSSSARLGSNESIRRLLEAGLISKEQADGPATKLSLRDRVLMHLFNTHSDIFTNRAKKKEALRIVDACLESYAANRDEK